MDTRTHEGCTLWVCIDCMMAEANGELPDGFDEDGRSGDERRPVPWARVAEDSSIAHVTAGMLADEHEDACPNYGYLPCPNVACGDGDVGAEDGPYVECGSCSGDGHGPRRAWDGTHDEPCEDIDFTWSSCDGCGSTLGGSRHAYTAWLVVD